MMELNAVMMNVISDAKTNNRVIISKRYLCRERKPFALFWYCVIAKIWFYIERTVSAWYMCTYRCA